MTKITLSIEKLEHIIALAKKAKSLDSSLSSSLEFELNDHYNAHNSDDHVSVWVNSGYVECNGECIYNHWLPVKDTA